MFQIRFGKIYREALGISIMRLNYCFTYGANKFNKSTGFAVLIEDRLSPILVTLCTYPMRWFGIAHGFFKRIYDCSCPWGCKLIAFFLTFPCFYASDFFFKCSYLINHRRLSRIGRKCAALGGQNGALKLNNLSLYFGDRLKLKNTLCDVASELEARNSALYERYIHDKSPLIK